MVNAILTRTYIQSTFITDQSKFTELSQNCKQLGKILVIKNKQKRPQAPKPIFLALESEKSENWIPNFENVEKYLKCAHKKLCRMDQTLFQTSS